MRLRTTKNLLTSNVDNSIAMKVEAAVTKELSKASAAIRLKRSKHLVVRCRVSSKIEITSTTWR